jgi:hypothetical protein
MDQENRRLCKYALAAGLDFFPLLQTSLGEQTLLQENLYEYRSRVFSGSVCKEFREEDKSSFGVDCSTYFPKLCTKRFSRKGFIATKYNEGSSPFSDSTIVF